MLIPKITIVTLFSFVARQRSVIHNIANQRVKECNRLAAMVTELTKCGVQARELEDGIEIVGVGGDYSKIHGAYIDCYQDHRIAMSFAVLGCKVPGIIVKGKYSKFQQEFYLHCNIGYIQIGIVLTKPIRSFGWIWRASLVFNSPHISHPLPLNMVSMLI